MIATIADWANVATISGALIAVFTLFYTAYQVHQHTLISRGQFWLELEKMFARHDEVHLKLRPGGTWHDNATGPKTVEEWVKVEDYMGLFEHCEIMLQKKLIDEKTFRKIFSYRLRNIVANKLIVQAKLIQEKDSWTDFINLLKRLDIQVNS